MSLRHVLEELANVGSMVKNIKEKHGYLQNNA
jgi:hypothetical protein